MRARPTLSLRNKFSAMLALFALLPSMALCLLLVRSSESRFAIAGVRNAIPGIEQVASSLQYSIQAVENIAATLSQDQVLQSAHDNLTDKVPLAQAIDTYWAVDRTLRYFRVNNDFTIRLFLPDYDRITSQEWSVYGLSALDGDDHIPGEVRDGRQIAGWSRFYYLDKGPAQGLCATYCHLLFSYSRYSPHNSVICVDIPASAFLDAFRSAGQPDNLFFLTDPEGGLLLSSDQQANTDLLAAFAAANQPSGSPDKLLRAGEYGECYYQRTALGSGGWMFHALVPVRQFQREVFSVAWYYLLFILLTALGILLTAHFVADSLVRELRDLTGRCIQVKNGDYTSVPGSSSTREIRVLQDTFRDMVERIDNLINDVYRERLAKQEARVEFLCEQMKPHFLYNTLESAKWMALRGGAPDVSKFMETLSRFFRLTLGKGDEWVTIQQEIELARTYVDIMNTRFINSIRFREEIEPSLMPELMIRLILQPFIENAILHGIFEKEGRTGTILLEAAPVGEFICLSISDDGIGMDESTLSRLNSCEKLGFGIANVRQRLALYYKGQSEVNFLRNESGGITVRVTVPRITRGVLRDSIE